MSVKIYGIKNCDTMKKSFALLDEKGITYEFVDYKKTPPMANLLHAWANTCGIGALINKQGTTYKKLPETDKAAMSDTNTAIDLLCKHPSMIRRPIVVYNNNLIVGKDALEKAFG